MAKPGSGATGNQRSRPFFMLTRGEGFKEALGNRFEYEGITMFAHRDEHGTWKVTEATSGLAVVPGAGTQRDAMREARETVDRIGADRLNSNLSQSIERYGSAYLGIQARGFHAPAAPLANSEARQALDRRAEANRKRAETRHRNKMEEIKRFQARHGIPSGPSVAAWDDDDLPF